MFSFAKVSIFDMPKCWFLLYQTQEQTTYSLKPSASRYFLGLSQPSEALGLSSL